MSLSRILNDDPAPGPSTRPARPVSPPFSSNLHVTQPDIPPSPHHAAQHRIAYPDARPPSPHSISTGRVERLRSPSLSVRDTPSHSGLRGQQDPALYQQYTPHPGLDEPHYRSSKRRRNEDEELQSPGYKRVHQPSKARMYEPETLVHGKSPLSAFVMPEHRGPRYESELEEKRRLLSTDLDDCREIWEEELQRFMVKAQRRRKEIEYRVNHDIQDQISHTAHRLSHHYAIRLSRMSSAQPGTMPEPVPIQEDHDAYQYQEQAPLLPYEGTQFIDSPSADHGRSAPANHTKKKGRESKRPAALSDASDVEQPVPQRKPAKRRKLDTSAPEPPPESFDVMPSEQTPKPSKGKGKAKAVPPPTVSASDTPLEATAKPGRKKGAGKKGKQTATAPPPPPPDEAFDIPPPALEGTQIPAPSPARQHLQQQRPAMVTAPPSIADDDIQIASRTSSPVPGPMAIVYDLGDVPPPLKKARKVDEAGMSKRVKTLEEAQKKVWTNIARRDIIKAHKYYASGVSARHQQASRTAKLASMQARRAYTKTAKTAKDTQTKAKRLMREMQVFWKKNEKEERDVRKKEQKEAMDRLKAEEERREGARQARKLEFLISQTELYSHFVGNKLRTSEVEGEGENAPAPAGAEVDVAQTDNLDEINFDDEDKTNLYRHAKHNAQEAIAMAKERAQQFDIQAALDRKNNAKTSNISDEAEVTENGEPSTNPPVDLDSDELNFQNPTSLGDDLNVTQPEMLDATLKEYQLKGLNWLATLYEQGINGILADEMGLGKTVQSISLLAYLAEKHDIWGPFLVVAPASTLHNWQQELTRFVPKLKALPYWGNPKDRATLRKFWSKKEISYDADAPFHVLITSYQLVTQDQQYFQRVRWQYMILDEAQNIKNSASVRWKTLLGFHCRNRLLLTGTPIQNSMQELWALLHFIMPSLFDSHDEFNEWFSKDIENAADSKGGNRPSEHQLRRLHMILKPFMLRRVKRHVQNELSEKIEVDVYVDLSARQRSMYKALLSKVSVADLIAKASMLGDAEANRTLMNLVMQFRKVCNHPEIFERADVVAPFSFARFGRSGPLNRDGDVLSVAYSTRNPIEFKIPQLFFTGGGLVDTPHEKANRPDGVLGKLLNIWSTDWMHHSLYETTSSSFAFLRLLGLSPQESHNIGRQSLLMRHVSGTQERPPTLEDTPYSRDTMFLMNLPSTSLSSAIDVPNQLPALAKISSTSWSESCLSKADLRWYIPAVVAPPIVISCSDRSFVELQSRFLDAPLESLAFYGVPLPLRDSEVACDAYSTLFPGFSPRGLMETSPADQIPVSPMQVPDARRLIYDSAKLARLDTLLQELKPGGHRVLVYSQMTKMLDLMEEYLIYRQYKYLRLDGSSKIEDRRDMVTDWQTKPEIFVFLLSTKAGGLGINLTAADTVVFYDHDWNPSNDAQAMDRAHRLGQTRQVTVYRLITKGTVDERIIQMARVKKDVQDIVVGSKSLNEVAKPRDMAQLLLTDEQLATMADMPAPAADVSTSRVANAKSVQDLWGEEDDDFFGGGGSSAAANGTPTGGENGVVVERGGKAGRGKKRGGATGAKRGRKKKVQD